MKKLLLLLLVISLLSSCDLNDDNSTDIVQIDVAEALAEDEAEITAFLQTHFYNEDEFLNPPVDFDFGIRLDTIAGENASRTPLIEQVSSRIIDISDNNGDITQHKLYYLVAREGVGAQPTVADSVVVQSERLLLDGSVITFDTITTPISIDLPGTSLLPNGGDPGVLRVFAEGITELRAGDDANGANGFGSGLVISSSTLNFFRITNGQTPFNSSPVLYTIRLFSVQQADHDQDGVLSILEDANGDNNLFNDDIDNDGIPDYLDPDTN